jgi:hypothetical protein
MRPSNSRTGPPATVVRVAVFAWLAVLPMPRPARAQGTPPAEDSKTRIEKLARDLQALKAGPASPAAEAEVINKLIDEKLKERDEAEKKKKEEEKK